MTGDPCPRLPCNRGNILKREEKQLINLPSQLHIIEEFSIIIPQFMLLSSGASVAEASPKI